MLGNRSGPAHFASDLESEAIWRGLLKSSDGSFDFKNGNSEL